MELPGKGVPLANPTGFWLILKCTPTPVFESWVPTNFWGNQQSGLRVSTS